MAPRATPAAFADAPPACERSFSQTRKRRSVTKRAQRVIAYHACAADAQNPFRRHAMLRLAQHRALLMLRCCGASGTAQQRTQRENGAKRGRQRWQRSDARRLRARGYAHARSSATAAAYARRARIPYACADVLDAQRRGGASRHTRFLQRRSLCTALSAQKRDAAFMAINACAFAPVLRQRVADAAIFFRRFVVRCQRDVTFCRCCFADAAFRRDVAHDARRRFDDSCAAAAADISCRRRLKHAPRCADAVFATFAAPTPARCRPVLSIVAVLPLLLCLIRLLRLF